MSKNKKKIGIYGKGRWGKILIENLKKISDIKYIRNTKSKKAHTLSEIDWGIVVTPDKTHFKIVKNFLENKKNVFCEKPLSRSPIECKYLYNLAKKNKVKLYVSDIEIFRKIKIEKNFTKIIISRGKKTECNFKEILYKLMYHDIYILYGSIKKLKILKINCYRKNHTLRINIFFKNKMINFNYNKNSKKKYHIINNLILKKKENLVLKMFKYLFSNKVDFNENKKRSLYCINLINKINNQFF